MKQLSGLLFILFLFAVTSTYAQTTTDTWTLDNPDNVRWGYALGVDVDSAGTGYSQNFLISKNFSHDFSTQPATLTYYLETADSINFAIYWMGNNTSPDSLTHYTVVDTLFSAIVASGANSVTFDLNEIKTINNKLKWVNTAPNAVEFSAGFTIE